MAALQDHDLEFPEQITFAYYSIYNLFGRYMSGDPIDDWLIVNQTMAAAGEDYDVHKLLEEVISFAVAEPV
ncbi:MAG TPA: hypothetical protein VKT33_14650 [Candidatus Angelobacter sp.]|nr:hypothetical protein [Candidatus Angelobacter sp.]